MSVIRRWLKALSQNLDEVAREKTNDARVSTEPAHPPEPIASIEGFDQISFDEAEVFLRLAAP